MQRQTIALLLWCALAAVFPSAIFSQRAYQPKFWLGADGGVTFSNMQFAPSVKQSMLGGKTLAFRMRYAEEKYFGLIGELVLEQRGWKEDFKEDKDKFNYSRALTYVTIPVMTHIYFGGSRVKGFVNLGPSVSYLLSDKITSNFDYENPVSVEGFPYQNRELAQLTLAVSSKFDYGISAGAGAEFFIGKNRRNSFSIEGRYYYGLGSIFPSHKTDRFSASRGTSISVTLGYWFRAFGTP